MALHLGRIDLLEEHLRRERALLSRTFSHREIYPAAMGCGDPLDATVGTPLDGTMLLHMCVEFDELEIARWLLDQGTDVNARAAIGRNGFGGYTALFNTVVSQPNFWMNYRKRGPIVAPFTAAAQRARLAEVERGLPRTFEAALASAGLYPLQPTRLEILQINVGKRRNQTCRHCHVDVGPDRREVRFGRNPFRSLGSRFRGKDDLVVNTVSAPPRDRFGRNPFRLLDSRFRGKDDLFVNTV